MIATSKVWDIVETEADRVGERSLTSDQIRVAVWSNHKCSVDRFWRNGAGNRFGARTARWVKSLLTLSRRVDSSMDWKNWNGELQSDVQALTAVSQDGMGPVQSRALVGKRRVSVSVALTMMVRNHRSMISSCL
jgi:hypothetical protein